MAIFSATLVGVQPLPVEIEIDISGGLPFFQIVGLPDAVLKESKTRVKSAIIQAGFKFPYDRRVVLNLAPSEVKKEGSSFELGLAARILAQSGQISLPEFNTLFLGELALDGTIRPVPEMGALAFAAENMGALVIPKSSLRQMPKAPCPLVIIEKLQDLLTPQWWESNKVEKQESPKINSQEKDGLFKADDFTRLRFSEFWARHLEIAAVGGHHYLICGPPGCGKTFFAESLRSLLDLLPHKSTREVEILNALFRRTENRRPWSAPHHSATAAGLVGGGSPPRPGAVTQAHGGILFLDELLEFSGAVLDSLREPLEKGVIEIHRAGRQMSFPTRFQLVAATNPCRCGNWGHPLMPCLCRKFQRQQYQARMSGPFFDRFDVRLEVKPPLGSEATLSGEKILKRVKKALAFNQGAQNKEWSPHAKNFLTREDGSSMPSYRFLGKVSRLAETLASLDESSFINLSHVVEAEKIQAFKMHSGA